MSNRSWLRNILLATAVASVGWYIAAPAFAETAAAKKDTSIKIDGEYTAFGITDASLNGHKIDQLINIVHWFMGVLFVGWGIFFVFCLVRFRQRPGHKAEYELTKAKPSKYIEVGVAIFEAVLLLGFSIPIWASVKNELPQPSDKVPPVRVRVVAEQFLWNFHYPGADGKFGKVDPKLVDTQTNSLGLDKSGDGADDILSQEFHIPVDRPIICDITSKDVIHSFFLPVMRVKQDAIPGMRIPTWFQATKTGTYEVACAQLCGNNHYSMRALMYVQNQTDFDKWLVEKAKPAEEFKD